MNGRQLAALFKEHGGVNTVHVRETMPTALPDWTTERPNVQGFYWWRLHPSLPPEVVRLVRNAHAWVWFSTADDEPHRDSEKSSSLWWPVRLDPPQVGVSE